MVSYLMGAGFDGSAAGMILIAVVFLVIVIVFGIMMPL